jgi:hypothetical protein
MSTFGMPPAYVGAPLLQPRADAGTCILTPNEVMIRPKIGGRRTVRRHKKKGSKKHNKSKKNNKSRKQRAGFLPSIGEPFVAAAGKYVAPLALFGLYKYMKNKPTKIRRFTRRV